MEFFNRIGNWFKSVKERLNTSRRERKKEQLEKDCCLDINVTEFNGRLYISYLDIPIVRVQDLKEEAPEILLKARVDYLAWKDKFDDVL